MKPSWGDAPEWANYLTMDWDGQWIWHQNKPIIYDDEWRSTGIASIAEQGVEPKDSLEQRPSK